MAGATTGQKQHMSRGVERPWTSLLITTSALKNVSQSTSVITRELKRTAPVLLEYNFIPDGVHSDRFLHFRVTTAETIVLHHPTESAKRRTTYNPATQQRNKRDSDKLS